MNKQAIKIVEVWQIRNNFYTSDSPITAEGTEEEMKQLWKEVYYSGKGWEERLGLYCTTYELIEGSGDR